MRGIYLIRHSNTTYDKKVDALLNPPLDEEGMERIKRTAKFLDSKGIIPKRIISSPLQRALLVAETLAKHGVAVTTHNEALPWNLGDIMGMSNKVADPKIEYLLNYPDIKAPHGESYRTFYTRWSNFLMKLMAYAEAKPDEAVFVTTHSRNINALQEIIRGAPIGDVQETTPEASVTLLAKNGVSDWHYELIWDGH
jgi:broad specificity phosphatase PhoE